jgi:hypothetical protein
MAHMIERLDTGEEQLTRPRQGLGKLQRAGESLGAAVGKTVAKFREFATLARANAEIVKEQRPLQFLAIFAGVAAVAGFGTRVWRSRRNA